MKIKKITDTALKVCTAVLLLTAFLLTFTVSDYYIFNRFDKYGFFAVCQWIKKCGLLVIPLAVFFDKKCCKDIAKYVLPVFVIVSFFTFGDFFDVTPINETSTADELIYAKINAIIPKTLNMSLFFIQGAIFLIICAMLFITDGFKFKIKSCIWLAPAIVAVTPLNIFENFFNIENFNENSFLWFKNFSLWHFLAVAALAGYTVSCYYFLRKKDAKLQNEYLAAAAIVLLIHYHSKDSMIMGDGYNVYHTIFACVPLFICNIGVYMAALSVFLKKRILYSISFYVHAAGALSVFCYFSREGMSNYGIIFSYSFLFFTVTHAILFSVSVLPSALGHYRYRTKDCIIPLLYYFIIIITASVASALVSSASLYFEVNGEHLSEMLMPNYAFTQINPLPFTVPFVKLTIWKYDLSVLYILGLYAFYVGIFFVFNAAYFAFIYTRKFILSKLKKADKEEAVPDDEAA